MNLLDGKVLQILQKNYQNKSLVQSKQMIHKENQIVNEIIYANFVSFRYSCCNRLTIK